MTVAATIPEVRRYLEAARSSGATIGLVPTMGYLHEGHLSLIRRARSECQVVVVSIFVNPTQFGPTEDLVQYPRDFERDRGMCQEGGADLIFCPPQEELYPMGTPLAHVDVDKLTEGLCGARRPGHFRGVATVVAKLFNIVQPHRAYFGDKDYQQLLVVRQMVRDLDFPIEIVGCPTVREADGLAMSSRNSYLSPHERIQAPVIYRTLCEARARLEHGDLLLDEAPKWVKQEVEHAPLARVEYVEVADAGTLGEPKFPERPVVIAAAVWLGQTRLIDHVVVEEGRGMRDERK